MYSLLKWELIGGREVCALGEDYTYFYLLSQKVVYLRARMTDSYRPMLLVSR